MIPRPCLTPGCPNMAAGGARHPRCRPCQRKWDANRNSQPERAVYADPNYTAFPLIGACELCGSTDDLTRDHIIPISKGGTNDPSNLRILCRPCNSAKHDKD